MAVRILVVDDHDIVRQGVRAILRTRPGWEICGESDNGVDALKMVEELQPDVVVLDVSMPGKDGLAVASELRQRKAACKTVVLTMHNSTGVAEAIQKTGAQGYVVKSHAAQNLVPAIETILEGGLFFSFDPAQSRPGWSRPQ